MKYQHPSVRREMILRAAIKAARTPVGFITLTRARIADHAECSEGLVSRYLGSMEDVRRIVLEIAIDEEILPIIAQYLAFTGGKAKIPTALKQKALRTLSGK